MRRAARRDSTHNALTAAFEKLGYAVLDLSHVGAGCPDVLICNRGNRKTALIEFKSENGKIAPNQAVFAAEWPGLIFYARNMDDMMAVHRYLTTAPLRG